jgi:hypothetical protein
VEWLAAEWEQASPVLDRVMGLLTWKNESEAAITEKLSAVREALLAVHEKEPAMSQSGQQPHLLPGF